MLNCFTWHRPCYTLEDPYLASINQPCGSETPVWFWGLAAVLGVVLVASSGGRR